MGESDQEEAARAQRDDMSRLQERFLTGDLSGEAQFAKVNPYFDKAMQSILEAIRGGTSARIAGVGQQVGESLVTGGVPPGHGGGSAFTAALAPVIAGEQEQVGSAMSGIERMRGMTLADLLKFSSTSMLQANQLENQAIGGMKSSTGLGDVFGGLEMFANIFASLADMGLDFSKLFDWDGGGGNEDFSNTPGDPGTWGP